MKRPQQAIPVTLFLLVALLSPLVAGGASLKPSGVRVLFYSKGVMAQVYRNRTNPSYARSGDYVRGMRLRKDVDGMTAVNYQSRWMLAANVVIVADIWDSKQKRWERYRLQAVDHQQRRHSTGSTQRLEVEYSIAQRVNMVRAGTTTARIVRVER